MDNYKESWPTYGLYKECMELLSAWIKLKMEDQFREALETMIDVLAAIDLSAVVKNLNVLKQNIFRKENRAARLSPLYMCFVF